MLFAADISINIMQCKACKDSVLQTASMVLLQCSVGTEELHIKKPA